ncbi:MAG: phosphate acyltransferase PlsX [Firmicutes bacterium]|nr:phosphate acyltransferase PlsX [Bacillota bacterium]
MKIILDAFGGDYAPAEVIAGGLDALAKRRDLSLIFAGKEAEIEAVLKGRSYDAGRVEILNAPEVISCEEEPTAAIKRKPDSSLCVGFRRLKEDEAVKGFVSAGSTGAFLVGATLKLGRIKEISRPALCPVLPTEKDGKQVLLLDAGANADCKPINLLQFALMGAAYAEAQGVVAPKVALLSNGTEDTKGNALNREVFPLLKDAGINFVGNMEARDILSGETDVVVTDGFAGNVALKSLEGGIASLMAVMKQEIMSTLKGKIGGLLLKDAFRAIKNKMDYNKQGGAVFLGVEKVVVKAHGSSKAVAVSNAVLQAAEAADRDIIGKIKLKLADSAGETV